MITDPVEILFFTRIRLRVCPRSVVVRQEAEPLLRDFAQCNPAMLELDRVGDCLVGLLEICYGWSSLFLLSLAHLELDVWPCLFC